MDVKEKRKALQHFCRTSEACGKCIFHGIEKGDIVCMVDFKNAPDEMIEKWHAMAFPEESVHSTGSISYESEFHRLHEENAKLKEEIKYMQMGARELRENNDILRAKLDMVYLIFGGGRNV